MVTSFDNNDITDRGAASVRLFGFSSPEPLAHHELLSSLDVPCAFYIINNCFKGHLLNYWLDFDQTWQE